MAQIRQGRAKRALNPRGSRESPPPLDPTIRRKELSRLRTGRDDHRLREPPRHDDPRQRILVLDGGAMGADERFRLAALHLRDDQNLATPAAASDTQRAARAAREWRPRHASRGSTGGGDSAGSAYALARSF